MKNEAKFYFCQTCGNIVEEVVNNGPKLFCCGKAMEEIVANSQEAATEKHIPVVKVEGNLVNVEVGSVIHPMTEGHYIGWVYLITNEGTQMKHLSIDKEPKVQFAITEGETVKEVYAYCNLHGLWKA
ncbi:desulfoferrodoxin family protein [Romboutsia sp.]|uniref:desulfoferrodoxin family protein n=1 Tax=Romboutsia sp. TaxID=1965302 RepID=UPI003F2EFB27